MSNFHISLKWSFLGEIVSKAISPLILIVLARLLTPEDFGVVVAATMVISFSQFIWEAGLGKAIIQYQGARDPAANAAFWINVLLGVIVALGLMFSAGFIAESVFRDSRVTTVLQVMSLQVVFSAIGAVHSALLQKDMKFKKLFWVRIATTLTPALVSIPMAISGWGYWALVGGSLTGQLLQFFTLWVVSTWRPKLSFDFGIAKDLVKFGRWVAATAVLGWFFNWADSLAVGAFLSSKELGLYRTGNAFVQMIYSIIFGSLLPVLYSHLANFSKDLEAIRNILIQVIQMMTFLSLPLAAILFANSEVIETLVFGFQWSGIGLIVSVMSLVHGIAWIVGANGEVFRAIGLPAIETRILAISVLIYTIGYLVSIQFGFETFIWARLGLTLVGVMLQLWFLDRVLAIRMAPIIKYASTLFAICAFSVLVVFQLDLQQRRFGMLLESTLSVVLVIVPLLFLERRNLLPILAEIIRKSIRSS
ncbi:MAG: lipopolysaccharide biosynthesis protein [Xanthomonadales bacterium]|jgi:PST family polysaccharide transporter|nr:lipopolysaccharide biosynthesis protein [Xanthomonadales bacterium]